MNSRLPTPSRNRPRRQLAWLILLVLAALVALAARIDAAAAASITETADAAEAAEDPITLAIRYADEDLQMPPKHQLPAAGRYGR